MSNLMKQAMQNNKNKKTSSQSQSDDSGEEQDQMGELGVLPEKKSKKNTEQIDPNSIFPIIEYIGDTPLYYLQGKNDLIFLCIHGAGLSGVSFSLLASKIAHFASCASFDFEGHGNYRGETKNDSFSMSSLTEQVLTVLKTLFNRFPQSTVVLVGHSLGGSVAAKVSNILETESDIDLKRRVVGLIIIDVVEGSALDALPFMKNLLIGRPKYFQNLEEATKYMIKSRTLNNEISARVSTNSQFVEKDGKLHWRTNLLDSEPWWEEWFKGLNSNFLGCQMPKILILAQADRMDKELTIAQMQGKFKLVVFTSQVGHLIHEDDPDQTADNLLKFLRQFRVPLNIEQLARMEIEGIGKFNNGI
jgi:protein phosphatase methylesterase 1